MNTGKQSLGSRKSPFQKNTVPKKSTRFGLYAVFTLLVATNIAMGLAMFMSAEITQLLNKPADPVIAAYETRMLQLRMEVDRLHSRQYLQAGSLNLRLQELLQQQQVLSEQHEYIRVLAQKAEELGITTAALDAPPIPAQLNAPVVTGSIFVRTQPEQDGNGTALEVDNIASSLTAMITDSSSVLTSIFDDASRSTSSILDQLKSVGITPDLSQNPRAGIGGPLIPISDEGLSNSLIQQANQALLALERFSLAKTALNSAPIHFPLATYTRISSGFGSRHDPFGGSRAFHSGIDYPAVTGTKVFSAGQGKVTFAGRRNGYGNLIEIDHGGGIVTRYAHLSAILVRVDQQVQAGFTIGKVGSTGRSTGPHLHFEVRRNQTAVNPSNFLAIARNLRSFIS